MNQTFHLRKLLSNRWLRSCALSAAVRSLPSSASAQLTFLNTWGTFGTGPSQFNDPVGVAVGPDGTVYVADDKNTRVEMFTVAGTYTGAFGSKGTGTGQFMAPAQIAVSSAGTVYVTDFNLNHVDMFSSLGISQGSFGSSGTGGGQFEGADGVAISPAGLIYVTDTTNNRVEIFNSTGTFQFTFGSTGSSTGQFETPISVAVAPNGDAYVSDFNDNRVEVFTAAGIFQSTFNGSPSNPFSLPNGIAADSNGNIYVVDENNNRLQVFNSANVFQSDFGTMGTGNGQFTNPGAVAVAPTGMVYVTDQANNRIERLFSPAAWVSGTDNFTDPTVGPTTLSVGTGQILGTNLTLNSNMGLNVSALSVQSSGTFIQLGGSFSTGSLSVSGIYDYLGGAFNATGATGITLAAGGIFDATQGGELSIAGAISLSGPGAQMNLDDGAFLTAPAGVTVSAGAVIDIGNATVSSGTGSFIVSSGGEAQLADPNNSILLIPSGSLQNSGLVDGSGRISGTLLNNSSGQVSASSGQSLTITGAGNVNAGLISLSGGSIHFNQDLTNQNTGQIDGDGTLRIDGGLTNNGSIALGGLPSYLYATITNAANATLSLSGSAYVFGNLTNNSNATVHLSGNTPNVFYGTFANSGSLNVDAGAIGLLYGIYTGAGPIINNGSLFIHANSIAGPITGGGILTLGEIGSPSTLQLLNLNTASTQSGITINSGSTLDLANNKLVLNFSAASDPIASIVANIASGYNGGSWTGSGITSSTAMASNGKFAIGYLDGNLASDKAAGTVAANQIIVKYTLTGDAFLENTVGFDDLLTVAQNYGATGKDWAQGSFDYTGSVGFGDLLSVAQNYGGSSGISDGSPIGDTLSLAWQSSQSAVPIPEPTAIALLPLAGFICRRRKKPA